MDSSDIPLDSLDGLKALCKACLVPDELTSHLIASGFVTVALLGHAISSTDEIPDFVDSLKLDVVGMSAPPFSPARSALTRVLTRSIERSQWNGVSGERLTGGTSVPQPVSKPKLTVAEVTELREKFEANYPGELICDQTMPSLTFLSVVKDMKDSDVYKWIPWKSRVSEYVQAQFNEARPPRNDRQLLRSLMKLEDIEALDQPSNFVPTSGPVESPLLKFQHLFAVALAMVDAAHLLTLKRFNHKFQQLALSTPRDQALRPPSLQEVLDADRAIWASIFAVKSENKWSLNDSLNEITFCRQELQGLLQPRLFVATSIKPRKKQPLEYTEDVSEFKKQKTAKPDEMKFDDSWFRKYNGKGICIRYNIGQCKSGDKCRYLHICPVPDAKNKICGAKHSARNHKKSPHGPMGITVSEVDCMWTTRSTDYTSSPGEFDFGPVQTKLSSDPDVAADCSRKPACFLDLFAGARAPVFSALRDQSYECIEPIDKINGVSHDILDDSVLEAVLRLASSTLVGVSLAAPYCSKHSRATLFPDGPPPARTPAEPEGCLNNTLQQDIALQESAAVHDRSRIASDLVMVHGGISAVENPLRSMTWLDPIMSEWVRQQTPFVSVAAACQFGEDWDKSWLFVCNHHCIHQVAASCPHPKHSHKQVAGVRLPDGSFFSRLTAAYPDALAGALATCFAPHLTNKGLVIQLKDWIQFIPRNPTWHSTVSRERIEDGGSLASTALWISPQHPDVLHHLRVRWHQRLTVDHLAHRIAQSLRDGEDEPPVDASTLSAFLRDIQQSFHISANDWNQMLEIHPGQPFRLNLWKFLLQLWTDPDVDLIPQLRTGARLGVNHPLAPSPIWPRRASEHVADQPLSLQTGHWSGADEHPDVVAKLLQEELEAGWIEEVEGGEAELLQRYSQVAIGKLNLVIAPGRSPRLVVDSSISGVTANTCIPNRMSLPRTSDVIDAAPDGPTSEECVQLTLDVAKAHRRITLHPDDGGLLCFHFQQRLFRSVTLNFGARASGYYWGRVAGMLMRTLHRIIHVRHSMFIYVDDLLAILDSKSAPIYASMVVLMCLCLGVPLTWKKTQLQSDVVWIGWEISTRHWTVTLTSEKRSSIIDDLNELLRVHKIPLKLLERITGKLLWVTSAWHQLRPLLSALYLVLSSPSPTLISLSLNEWMQLVQSLDDSCVVTTKLPHPSLVVGVRIFRVGNCNVYSLQQLRELSFRSRRIWPSISDPHSPWRRLTDELRSAAEAWRMLLSSTSLVYSMLPRPTIECHAAADAMATDTMVGIDAIFPSGITGWFQLKLYAEDFEDVAKWAVVPLQHNICAFELLGQCLLLQLVSRLLGGRRQHCTLVTACDNTASEVAATKGISGSIGI